MAFTLNMLRQKGISLIELMVAISIAMILFLVMGTTFTTQNAMVKQYTQEAASDQEARLLFKVFSNLLRQASICGSCSPVQSVSIVYNQGTHPSAALSQTPDELTLTFYLPENYKIWPNSVSNAGVYDKNVVQVHWDQASGVIQYRNAASESALASAVYSNLETPTTKTPRVVKFELWPMLNDTAEQPNVTDTPNGGYRLCLVTRSAMIDQSYNNPEDPSGALKNYRTSQVCGRISPRNW